MCRGVSKHAIQPETGPLKRPKTARIPRISSESPLSPDFPPQPSRQSPVDLLSPRIPAAGAFFRPLPGARFEAGQSRDLFGGA